MPWYEEATSCSFSKQWFEFCVSQTSSCKLCPWAASKATVGSSSCGSLDPGCLGTGSFRGTNSTLNTLQLWQMTFPRCYLSFKMDSIAGVLFFQLTQHVLFTAGSRNIYVTFGLTTSNHIPPLFCFIALLVMEVQPPIVLSLLLYKLLNIAMFHQFRARQLLQL